MRITRVDVCPVSIPYRSPYGISQGTAPDGKHVIIKVYTDQGVVGYGEAATIIPERAGGTQESIAFMLRDYFAPAIIGDDPLDYERILYKVDHIPFGRHLYPFAKAAIDHALFDIVGKVHDMPVYKVLGGACRKQIGVSRSIRVGAPEEMAEIAVKLREDGYRMLTLKGTFDTAHDVEALAKVRAAVGEGYPLEIDPNQAYPATEAIRVLRRMEAYGLQSVEQPCPWWDIDGMAEVARALDTPIIADEMVQSTVEAMTIAKRRAADILCLKLTTMGGIAEARKIVAIAEAAGLGVSMASRHTFGVGTAAIHHFVAATPAVQEPIGYGSALERFVDDIVTEPTPFKHGVATVLEGPGLGVELDEAKLRRYGVTISIP